jgi:cytochrome c biogenesis protein CcmG, thiol:disulfide interchange protein DsbE
MRHRRDVGEESTRGATATGQASSPAEGLEGEVHDSAPRRRSQLRIALQAVAVIIVGALLVLLVYRMVETNRGRNLVAAIRAHKKPPAPDFRHKIIWPHFETWPQSLQTLRAGETLSRRDLQGHPVVLNFWASWCIPCRREAPRLNASAAAHKGRVVYLGVDVNDFTTDARRFLRRHRVNYVSVRARGLSTYEDFGLRGLPETYFLDVRGRIVAHTIGEITSSGLEDGVAQALGPRS